jgi:hypothetical protein
VTFAVELRKLNKEHASTYITFLVCQVFVLCHVYRPVVKDKYMLILTTKPVTHINSEVDTLDGPIVQQAACCWQ